MKKLYLSIVFLSVGSAFAQSSSSPSNFKYHDLPNGQRIFVPFNSPLPSSAQQAGQQLWNQAIANTATGQVEVGRSTTVPNPAGSPVPATARGRLPAPAVAAAAGRVFAAAAKTIGPIGLGLAIYDLAKEVGFEVKRSNTGGIDFDKVTTSGGTGYSTSVVAGTFYSALDACQAAGNATGYPYVGPSRPDYCFVYRDAALTNGNAFALNTFAVPTTTTSSPSNQQALIDAIAAKSGWPVSSKIGEVVLLDPDASQQTPVEIVVSGPASSPGPTSQTTNTTNNTTNNSTTTYNHTYAGDKITTNVSTVNITTNNSTGAVTNNETSTSTPGAPPPPPSITCGLPGTPACKLDEAGTPSGVGTTYDASKTAIDAAKTSAETNITGAASIAAPAWSFSFALPTGCAPYVTGIKGVVLNVCQYQSTIHGLLSVIWAAATAFAMIGMVGRTIREA